MKFLARFFSTILHPLFMPYYGITLIFLFSYMQVYPAQIKLTVALSILGLTGLLPGIGIFLLYKFKQIQSVGLNNRKDRLVPYLITALSYGSGAFFLYKVGMPYWVLAFVGGGILALLIDMAVNFGWKISAHMTGIGGLIGLVLALGTIQSIFPQTLLVGLILGAGILGTSRIYLDRHTFWQVIAGALNGMACVYWAILLSIRYL